MKTNSLSSILSFALLAASFPLVGCGKSDAGKASETAQSIPAALKPGEEATSPSGYLMKAQVSGKEWVATSMIPPDAAGRIVGSKGEESISLPFHRGSVAVGTTIRFSENKAVDLMLDDDVGVWAGYSGEMQYTQVDERSAEGTFHFTATSRNSTKKIEVTNGTFRVLLK